MNNNKRMSISEIYVSVCLINNINIDLEKLIKIIIIELLFSKLVVIKEGKVFKNINQNNELFIKKYHAQFLEDYLFRDLTFKQYVFSVLVFSYEIYRYKKENKIELLVQDVLIKEKKIMKKLKRNYFSFLKTKFFIKDESYRNELLNMQKYELDSYLLYADLYSFSEYISEVEFEKLITIIDDCFSPSSRPRNLFEIVYEKNT